MARTGAAKFLISVISVISVRSVVPFVPVSEVKRGQTYAIANMLRAAAEIATTAGCFSRRSTDTA